MIKKKRKKNIKDEKAHHDECVQKLELYEDIQENGEADLIRELSKNMEVLVKVSVFLFFTMKTI